MCVCAAPGIPACEPLLRADFLRTRPPLPPSRFGAHHRMSVSFPKYFAALAHMLKFEPDAFAGEPE